MNRLDLHYWDCPKLEGIEVVYDSVSGVQLTEIEEEILTKVQEEGLEAEVTFYALVGSPFPGTMRVEGRVKIVSLIILLDSRSFHNFIDAALMLVLQFSVDVS